MLSPTLSATLRVLLVIVLVGAVAGVLALISPKKSPSSPLPPAPAAPPEQLVIDFPPSWNEIPGKLSRTWRSPRSGAGFLQLSVHPPLSPGTDGPGAERELDTLLKEMVSDMAFGTRLSIGHASTKAGPLAFARYRSPEHGVLGFWLLAAQPMIFATYVDGGPDTAEKDIREAQASFLNARFE